MMDTLRKSMIEERVRREEDHLSLKIETTFAFLGDMVNIQLQKFPEP